MSLSSIPDWLEWCRLVADKVLNPNLRTDGFLRHTLLPVEMSALPGTEVFAILLPDEWLVVTENRAEIVIGDETMRQVEWRSLSPKD